MLEAIRFSSPPKRILLPRFDTLGDLVLLEGFLEALGRRFPDAKITLLIRRAYADLACLFPDNLDWQVVEVDPHKSLMDIRQCNELLECVRREPWDLILTTSFNRTWADDIVSAASPGAKRIAFSRPEESAPLLQGWLKDLGLAADSPYDILIDVAEESHEVEKYQRFWQAFDDSSPLPEPRLHVGECQAEVADRILASLQLSRKQYCLCFPAGTRNVSVKAWPEACFAEVVAWLEARHGIRSLIAGHRSELACLERIGALAREKGADPAIWTGRDGDMPILAALSEAASLYFGNDTGPMHIAAALQTPVVALFGGGTWPRFIPRGERSLVLIGEMPCFGCGWDCLFDDAPCMRLVGVQDAQLALEAHLQDRPGSELKPRVVKAAATLAVETRQYVEKAVEGRRKLVSEIKAIDRDRNERLAVIMQLESRLKAREEEITIIEADRKVRLDLIEKLISEISVIEADRAARLELIERLSGRIVGMESDLHKIRSNFLVRALAVLRLVPSP
jgi:ADP-heptose:LPS heptosyltransferase